jgi:hypothetical protein
MSTKSPTSVAEFSIDSLEKFVYQVASEIPAQEPNDTDRLGYCLWGWLQEHRGTLLQTIRAAGIRTKLSNTEILELVQKRFKEKNIPVS